MSTALQLRRGSTAQHASFTGAEGEVSVDTSKDTLVVHDGATAGGFPLAKESQLSGFRNRIINGDMRIDQRNEGASVTPTNGQYLTDRFYALVTAASKFTAQQDVGLNSFFTNSLKITSSSAYSIAAGDVFTIIHKIEGNNVSDLGWGTANAQAVTLSFVVNSSLTGTFGGSIMNASLNRSYPFSFSIPTAGIATNISVTIPGDTTGTWGTGNGTGILLSFSIGTGTTFSGTSGAWGASEKYSATGATSVVGTAGATFYITGVQLEKGSVATPFEFRSIGQELALCQRYLPAWSATAVGDFAPIVAAGATSTVLSGSFAFPVPTRVPVTGVSVSSASHFTAVRFSTGNIALTNLLFRNPGSNSAIVEMTAASGIVADVPYYLYANNASARIFFTGAEL